MPKHYISFLLRLWKADSHEEGVWRVMIEDPHNHEVCGFNSLEAFFSYLQKLAAGELTDPNDQDQFAGNQ